MTTTSAYGACSDFVADLEESHLLGADGLRKVGVYLKAYPQRGPAELADFLVEQGVLTRFQADTALDNRAWELVLANFVLTDVIGSGSMGTVYKARRIDGEGTYAIKIIPRRNTVVLPTVVEKIKAFKDMRHPRVSCLVHIGAAGERVYLVWPFLADGEKLAEMVKKQGRMTPRQAVQVGLQTASGLQAYHEKGLFHGLLKPSDILIGADKRVRILDFGVGFLLTSERGKSLLDTITNTKTLARGVDCASPESIMNPLDRTVRGDQYSLGCILYYCLAGQFPFPEPNPVKKMLGHQFEEPQPIRELNPEVSPKLAGIVHRLLKKKPEERFPNMEAVVQAFQALAGPPKVVVATPTPPPARTPVVPIKPVAKAPAAVNPSQQARDRVAQVAAAKMATAKAEAAAAAKAQPAQPAQPPEPARPSFWAANRSLIVALGTGLVLGVVAWILTST